MRIDALRSSTTRIVACAAITVTALAGCGSDGATGGDAFTPVREYAVALRAEERGDDYVYVAEDALDLRVGDRVRFEMDNAGALIHDLVVVHPDGQTIATGAATAPGDTLSVVVDFADPGFYRLNCLVDDHLTAHGMQEFVEVTDAA